MDRLTSLASDRKAALLVPGILLLLAGLVFILSFSVSFISSGNRLKQLVELGSIILAFNAIVICIRNFAPERLRRHFFPILIAASSTILLIGFRYVLGAGVGQITTEGGAITYSGILHNPMDNYSYGTWIMQAKQGRFTFFDLYTVQPHEPLYFNFLFLTLGTFARWLEAPPLPTLIVAGIIASAILVMIAFYIPIRAGLPKGAAKWSCVLAAFSSGMSGSLNLIGRQIGINTPPGADLRYQDAVLFSSFYSYPYHTIAMCILSALILFIVSYDTRRPDPPHRSFPLFLIAITALLLNFTHPYEGPLLLIAYGTYCILIFFQQKFDTMRSRFWLLCVLSGITAIATLYNFWVSQHPVWHNFAQISLSLPARRSFWILGYGLMLPASILGTWISFRKKEYENVRWMGVIPLLTLLLLVILSIRQTKILSGAYLFMCILAGLCCYTIQIKIRNITSNSTKNILSIAGIFIAALFFMNSALILIFFLNPIIYEPGLLKAAIQIHTYSQSENPLLLCDSDAGMTMPLLSAARVYSGHIIMTPEYSSKNEELANAGFESISVNAQRPESEAFLELLRSAKFEFVLVKQTRPAYVFARQIQQLKLIGCYDQKCLFTTPFTNHQ